MSSYDISRDTSPSLPILRSTSDDIYLEISSEAMATDGTAQEGCNPTNAMATTCVEVVQRALFEAITKGDVRVVNQILDQNPRAATTNVIITSDQQYTALDVAVIAAQDEMVENLVNRIPDKSVTRNPEEDGHVILHGALIVALKGGKMRVVKAILDRDPTLKNTLSIASLTPLQSAPIEKELLWYLVSLTQSPPSDDAMKNLIFAGHSDVGLYLARTYLSPTMAMEIIDQLATMPHLFYSGARLNLCERLIYKCIPLCLVNTSLGNSENTKMAQVVKRFKISFWNLASGAARCIKEIGELKLIHNCFVELANLAFAMMKNDLPEFLLTSRIVLNIADLKIFELLKLSLKFHPELTWHENLMKELIKVVVKKRDVDSFRLLNTPQLIQHLSTRAEERHSLMSSIIELSQTSLQANVTGEALLLQRELQWYKIVEDITSPLPTTQAFREEFLENRKKMLKEAGQWMKTTSTAGTAVATLIVTILFAAVFSIPGTRNNNIMIPILMKKTVFMIATKALILSLSAAVIFLSIITSRHIADDFLHSLPRQMMVAFSLLLCSLILSMVGFSTSVALMVGKKFIPIALVVPTIVVLVIVRLLIEIAKSTYRPNLYYPLKI